MPSPAHARVCTTGRTHAGNNKVPSEGAVFSMQHRHRNCSVGALCGLSERSLCCRRSRRQPYRSSQLSSSTLGADADGTSAARLAGALDSLAFSLREVCAVRASRWQERPALEAELGLRRGATRRGSVWRRPLGRGHSLPGLDHVGTRAPRHSCESPITSFGSAGLTLTSSASHWLSRSAARAADRPRPVRCADGIGADARHGGSMRATRTTMTADVMSSMSLSTSKCSRTVTCHCGRAPSHTAAFSENQRTDHLYELQQPGPISPCILWWQLGLFVARAAGA
jgi:hypothetical protein